MATSSTARCGPVTAASGCTQPRPSSPRRATPVRRRRAWSCRWRTSTAHFAPRGSTGPTSSASPTDQEYGQHEYGVLDPEGHPWYFATPFAQPAGR